MKKFSLILLAAFVSASAMAQSSLWLFTDAHAAEVGGSWTRTQAVRATDFGDGVVGLQRSGENVSKVFKPYMKKNSPCVDGLLDGDSWTFTLPVGRLDAGSYVEFDLSLVSEEASPRYYIIEYKDGGVWKTMSSDVRSEDGIDYSFKCYGYVTTPTYQYTTVLQTVRFDAPVEGSVEIRARVAADCDCRGRRLRADADKSCTRIEWGENVGAYMNVLGTGVPRDTTSVLCIGNSFTYVYGASWMLKEIAWSQGHYLDLKAAMKGGQTLGQQLELYTTDEAVRRGGYDIVFLQNQSQTPAWYIMDPKGKEQIRRDAVTLANRVRGYSPDARIVMESTWSYPGSSMGGFSSLKEFDRLLSKGTKALSRAAGTEISPIGAAFALSRKERPDISLYSSDGKHQSQYGAYLKACVNYFIIFGEDFSDKVSDCHLDPEKAAYLRGAAGRIVKTK